MKTVYEIVQEYIKARTTPMRGFTVGDKVKTSSEYEISGEIVKVSGNVVTIEIGPKGNHDLKELNEYWLMSDDTNHKTR